MAGWHGDRYEPADQETWDRLRAELTLGQVLTGTVVRVPEPRAVDPAYRVADFDTWLATHDSLAAQTYRQRSRR